MKRVIIVWLFIVASFFVLTDVAALSQDDFEVTEVNTKSNRYQTGNSLLWDSTSFQGCYSGDFQQNITETDDGGSTFPNFILNDKGILDVKHLCHMVKQNSTHGYIAYLEAKDDPNGATNCVNADAGTCNLTVEFTSDSGQTYGDKTVPVVTKGGIVADTPQDDPNVIYIFYGDNDTAAINISRSTDGGSSFDNIIISSDNFHIDEPAITAGTGGKVIVGARNTTPQTNVVTAFFSNDTGSTWEESEIPNPTSSERPVSLEHVSGDRFLYLTTDSNLDEYRLLESTNGGVSWTEVHSFSPGGSGGTDFDNGGDIVIRDGDWHLFYQSDETSTIDGELWHGVTTDEGSSFTLNEKIFSSGEAGVVGDNVRITDNSVRPFGNFGWFIIAGTDGGSASDSSGTYALVSEDVASLSPNVTRVIFENATDLRTGHNPISDFTPFVWVREEGNLDNDPATNHRMWQLKSRDLGTFNSQQVCDTHDSDSADFSQGLSQRIAATVDNPSIPTMFCEFPNDETQNCTIHDVMTDQNKYGPCTSRVADSVDAQTLNNVVFETTGSNPSVFNADVSNLEFNWVKDFTATDVAVSNHKNDTTRVTCAGGSDGLVCWEMNGVTFARNDGVTNVEALDVHNKTVYTGHTNDTVQRWSIDNAVFDLEATSSATVLSDGLRVSKGGQFFITWDGNEAVVWNGTSMNKIATLPSQSTGIVAADIGASSFGTSEFLVYTLEADRVDQWNVFEQATAEGDKNLEDELDESLGVGGSEDSTTETGNTTLEEDKPSEGLFGDTFIESFATGVGSTPEKAKLFISGLLIAAFAGAVAIATSNSGVGAMVGGFAGAFVSFGVGLLPIWAFFLLGIAGTVLVIAGRGGTNG